MNNNAYKCLRIEELKAGMILADDIYKEDVLILKQNTHLTFKDVVRLRILNIQDIKIFLQEDCLSYKNENELKEFINNFVNEDTMNLDYIEDLIDSVLDNMENNEAIRTAKEELKIKSNDTYIHSLQTSMCSILTACGMNLSPQDLKKIIVGSVLHDIGKLNVNQSILYKKEKLTIDEFEEIKKHPIEGKKILIERGIYDEDILDIVSQHHEKIDGSGYPYGLKSKDINRLSKIVTVSDIYNALTTKKRLYRDKIRRDEAIEYLYCLVDSELDIDIVKEFSKNVIVYPKGSKVLLNNGEIGIVIDLNEALPTRPIIKILDNGKIVNMLNERTIFIESVL